MITEKERTFCEIEDPVDNETETTDAITQRFQQITLFLRSDDLDSI